MQEIEALFISAAIEAPIAFLVVRARRWPGRGPLHAGLAAAVATGVTHPQLWTAALWAYPRFGFWPSAVVLELMVVLIEGLLIAWMSGLSVRHAMLVSLAANMGSAASGLLLRK